MKLSDVRVDPKKIEEGEWIGEKYDTPIPEMGDLCLKVRGINNAAYRNLQETLINAVPRKERPGGRINSKTRDEIMSKCLMAACLDDWSGVEGDGVIGAEGAAVPYDKKTAHTLLFDPAYRAFRDAVLWAATQVGEARAEHVEAIAKN